MSTTTLTDRYVDAVVRRIPAGQRDDVAAELRATIADTVEARYPADDDPTDPGTADPDAAGPGAAGPGGADSGGVDAVERAVLVELGDPIRLAARYADRPLALIGPELFPTYTRLLVVLLSTVLPVVVAALVVIDVFDNNDLGSAIGTGIGGVFTVGGQLIAWLTVVFALIDRFGRRNGVVGAGDSWTPDDLPEPRQRATRNTGACASVVWNALLIGLIVWQHTAKPYRTDGAGGHSDRLQVLDPHLWSGWIWPILAGLAGLVVLEVVRATGRDWTMVLAGASAVAEAVFALPLAWILYRQMFFNPDFLTDVNGSWTVPDAFYTVAALGVLAVSAHQVFKRFRAARG